MVLTFECYEVIFSRGIILSVYRSVDEIVSSDHSRTSRDTVYYALQGGSNFRVCGWNFRVSIQMKQLIVLKTEVVLTLKSVDEILEQKLSGSALLGNR